MFKQIVELLMVIIIGFLPVSNTAETPKETTAVVAEVTSQQTDGVKIARFENMLSHNYCFGTDFQNYEALIKGAALSLAKNGDAEKSEIDGYIYNMYGVDTQGVSEEYYVLAPCGYDVYKHNVKSFTYNGDGTVTVLSTIIVNPDTSAEQYDCESVFYANGQSAFGYNLLSCDVKW